MIEMIQNRDNRLNIIKPDPARGPFGYSRINEALDRLLSEGGESFYKYVESLCLADKPELIVLSSEHHYYYDQEELSGVKTLINLKELNRIKDIKGFLQSCLYYLPPKSNFVGCFTDNEKVNGYELKFRSSRDNKKAMDEIDNGIVSSFPFLNMLYSLMDSRVYKYMSKTEISILLGEYGFNVLNMTEINGLTFFHSQKAKVTYN